MRNITLERNVEKLNSNIKRGYRGSKKTTTTLKETMRMSPILQSTMTLVCPLCKDQQCEEGPLTKKPTTLTLRG